MMDVQNENLTASFYPSLCLVVLLSPFYGASSILFSNIPLNFQSTYRKGLLQGLKTMATKREKMIVLPADIWHFIVFRNVCCYVPLD